MKEYLIETPSIDYMNPIIQEKFQELRNQTGDDLDYIKQSYLFVREDSSFIRYWNKNSFKNSQCG